MPTHWYREHQPTCGSAVTKAGTGSAAFIGLGGYTFISGRQQLREQAFQEALARSGSKFGLAARRAGIHGLSACLIGLGVYRLLM